MIPDDAASAMGGLAMVLCAVLAIVRVWDIVVYLANRF